MKRFAFRLEQVLRVKQQWKRLAEARQQQARAGFDAALAIVADLEGRLAQLAESLAVRCAQPGDGVSWLTRYEQATQLGQALDGARARAEQARRAFEEADRQRRKIAVEVEALFTLRREQWQQYRREVERQRQEQLDETSLRRWRGK